MYRNKFSQQDSLFDLRIQSKQMKQAKSSPGKTRVFQITNGNYQSSLRNKLDPRIINAARNNIELNYVKCNQLLRFQPQNAKLREEVYHRLQILQPIEIQITKQIIKSQSNSLFKSYLTAASQRSLSYLNHLSRFERQQREYLNSSLRKNSPLKLKQNKAFSTSLFKVEIQEENLTSSRLLTISKMKASKINSKIEQLPLGYSPINISKSNLNLKLTNEQIYIPPPQLTGSPLKYKTKLITLFDLKNSQSQDDLCTSVNGDQSQPNTYFNFGKITQSKIMGESDLKKSNLKISKLISNIHSSVIEANDKDQVQPHQTKQSSSTGRVILSPERKHSKSQKCFLQIRDNKVQDRNFSEEDLLQQVPKIKNIRGLKKCGKVKAKNSLQTQDKKIETPKFGKRFIWNT